MSHSARLLLSAAAASAAFALAAPVASADTVTVPNACQGSDGQYGDLPLQLTATATQNGRQLDVSGIQPNVVIPPWVKDKLNAAGAGSVLFLTGTRTVPVTAWMAVAGAGSSDAPQVVQSSGTLSFGLSGTTITSVSLKMGAGAATSWHVPDAGGTVSVGQAAAGTLPAGTGGAATPKGSLYIKGSVGGQTLSFDCQPGSTGGDGSTFSTTFTPGTAEPLVSSVFGAVAVVVPTPTQTPAPAAPATPAPKAPATPTPTPKAPAGGSAPLTTDAFGIASTSLKFGSAAVLLQVSCPAGGDDCTGSAVITSAKKLKIKRSKAKVRKLAAGTFSVKAGTTGTIKLKLSSDGKKLRKKALVASVTLKPTAGSAVTKRLRANR